MIDTTSTDYNNRIETARVKIYAAIKSEKQSGDQYIVKKKKQLNRSCQLTIELTKSSPTTLDEDYYNAWWLDENEEKFSATIKRSDLTEGTVCIAERYYHHVKIGQTISLYRYDFLKNLLKLWENKNFAKEALGLIADLSSPTIVKENQSTLRKVNRLRSAQQEAFGLIKYSSSYLWGPPGTGKTTTVASLISEYLQAFPSARVLLVSTSHRAIDDITARVDDQLNFAGQQETRLSINRYGANEEKCDLMNHENRRHLVSILNKDTRERFVKVMRSIGQSKLNSHRLKEIYCDDESLGLKTLDSISTDRLLCMTVTAATINFQLLLDSGKFDLLVFEEASQIGLAHSLMLMLLAKVRLFAGDPNQLRPVTRKNETDIKNWLGNSAFAFMKEGASAICMLDEQSRMAPQISALVSELFYKGKLHVASEVLSDWSKMRLFYKSFRSIPANIEILIARVPRRHFSGSIDIKQGRIESVSLMINILNGTCLDKEQSRDVLVVTPSRAQRDLIKRELKKFKGLDFVKVSTIHRAQGAEADIVFLDPGFAANGFLKADIAPNLVNVALSRAKCKLILLFSDDDLNNEWLSQVRDTAERLKNKDVFDLPDILRAPNWKAFIIGKRIRFEDMLFDVVDLSPSQKELKCVDPKSGHFVFVKMKNLLETVREHDGVATAPQFV